MNSMETFNSDADCLVHDRLNNELIAWNTEWAAHYREFAREFDGGSYLATACYLMDGCRIASVSCHVAFPSGERATFLFPVTTIGTMHEAHCWRRVRADSH
jgi:hypothetical protein